eukprot:1712961-Prymnesium_polylepis.1
MSLPSVPHAGDHGVLWDTQVAPGAPRVRMGLAREHRLGIPSAMLGAHTHPWVSAVWPFAWRGADAAGGRIVGIPHSRHGRLQGLT